MPSIADQEYLQFLPASFARLVLLHHFHSFIVQYAVARDHSLKNRRTEEEFSTVEFHKLYKSLLQSSPSLSSPPSSSSRSSLSVQNISAILLQANILQGFVNYRFCIYSDLGPFCNSHTGSQACSAHEAAQCTCQAGPSPQNIWCIDFLLIVRPQP